MLDGGSEAIPACSAVQTPVSHSTMGLSWKHWMPLSHVPGSSRAGEEMMSACTGLSIEVKVRKQSKGTWKQWGGTKEPGEEECEGEQGTGQVEHQEGPDHCCPQLS